MLFKEWPSINSYKLKRLGVLKDCKISYQSIRYPVWFKPLPGIIKFTFDAKYEDGNSAIATIAWDWFGNITGI